MAETGNGSGPKAAVYLYCLLLLLLLLFSVYFTVYQSPMYESMLFDLIVERLVFIGYPSAVTEYKYDPSFPVRLLHLTTTRGPSSG